VGVKVTGSGGVLTLGTSFPTNYNALSVCGWCKVHTFPGGGAFGEVCLIEDGGDFMGIDFNAGQLEMFNSGSSPVNFTNPAADQWFFWAIANSAVNAPKGMFGMIVLNGSTTRDTQTLFTNTPGTAPDHMEFLGDEFDEFLIGTMAYLKIWDAVLTQAEFENEMWSATPHRMANIRLWSPLWRTTDVKNYSGATTSALTPTSMSDDDNPPAPYRMISPPIAPIS